MILVDSLLYKIDQRLNKLSSNEHQKIQLEDKLLALNEAQIKLVKQKFTGVSTPSKMGFGAFKKRYQDIDTLLVDFNENSLSLEEEDPNINQWSSSLSELNPKMMLYADAYVLADKGKCKDRIIWINKDLVKHGDIQFLINNVDFAPSFEYQETFDTITGTDISIYTDGSFTPKELKILYVRYPQKIDKVGYIDFDGQDSINQDCELVDYLEDELLDLTIQNLADYTENMSAAQSARFRSMTNE
jgi:hypothetical protein